MPFASVVGGERYRFVSTRELLARASEPKRADTCRGLSARSDHERLAARAALADVVLGDFVREPVLPPESDDVSLALTLAHEESAFSMIAGLTVGQLRDCLLSDDTCGLAIEKLRSGITPEIASAVAKLMSNKDLILVAAKIHNITRLRNTLGGANTLHIRVCVSGERHSEVDAVHTMLDGLVYGCGDGVIAAIPSEPVAHYAKSLLSKLREVMDHCAVPTQLACIAPFEVQLDAVEAGAPIDLLIHSLTGTQAANDAIGVTLPLLREGRDRLLEHHHRRHETRMGPNVIAFRTGQMRSIPTDFCHGIDAQTLEARALGLARTMAPLQVISTITAPGPFARVEPVSGSSAQNVPTPLCESELIRSALEDHFMGKLLGLSMGCDICSGGSVVDQVSKSADRRPDRNTVDNVLTLLLAAGCDSIPGSPCTAQAANQYQSSSFHDAVTLRHLFGRQPAPEFAAWLQRRGLFENGRLVWGDGRCQEQLVTEVNRLLSPRAPKE